MKALHHTKKNFLPFVLLASIIGTYLPSAGLANQLPDLGSPDLIEYDTPTEAKLGRAFTSALYTHYNLYTDLETNEYIRNIGHQIASHVRSNRNFSFYIIDDPSINAFAGPDGVIGIHTGLIKAAETEDELAAVIAHEISHVTQNHLSRRYEYSTNQANIGSIASLIAAILIGMHDPSAGMAALMGGMGYNLQQQLKNSRQHESEADHIGIELLHKAGYNPHAMGEFFGRLSKQSQHNAHSLPEILRTHPVTENRLAEAENRAQTLKGNQAKKPDSQLNIIKLRLAHIQKLAFSSISNNQDNLDSYEKCYQQTLAYIKEKKSTSPCLANIKPNDKLPLMYSSLLLETINKQGKATSNRAVIDELIQFKLELHPQSNSLTLRYAEYLAQEENINAAIAFLNRQEKYIAYKYQLYKKLSEYYTKAKNESATYFNLARAYLETGNGERSEYFLKRAEDTLKQTDNALKAKIAFFRSKNTNLLKKQDKNK